MDATIQVDLDGIWTIFQHHGIDVPHYPDSVFNQSISRFLDLFAAENIKATFFVVGSDLEVPEVAKQVKLLLLDVDGVLTDGRIVYDSRGRDMKLFDVHDGLGVYILKKCGIKTILITAKGSKSIRPRARDMQVEEVIENIFPKSAVLDKILKKYHVAIDEICFVGDDLVDLCLMKRVGFAIAVFNAAALVMPSVRSRSHSAARISSLVSTPRSAWIINASRSSKVVSSTSLAPNRVAICPKVALLVLARPFFHLLNRLLISVNYNIWSCMDCWAGRGENWAVQTSTKVRMSHLNVVRDPLPPAQEDDWDISPALLTAPRLAVPLPGSGHPDPSPLCSQTRCARPRRAAALCSRADARMDSHSHPRTPPGK